MTSGGKIKEELKALDRVWPVILSGGTGTRLWPMSRALQPKQLLSLVSDFSLLQKTVRRVADPVLFQAPLLVCNEDHRFLIAEQVRQLGVEPHNIVLEPEGRNTAPATAVAALMLAQADGDGLMLVLPSDHVIQDERAFRKAVEQAAHAARVGALMTFGIDPRWPETGYGYIRRGKALEGSTACYRVEQFVEKPDDSTAEAFLADGGYYWNSGMFLFSATRYLGKLGRLEPAMLEACQRAVAQGSVDRDFFRLDRASFAASPSKSIDFAVMERTPEVGVVPVDLGWSDVGSWSALWDIERKNADGNVVAGDVLSQNVQNSYLRSEGPLVAAIGLENVIVVATDDAVLVAAKDKAEDVKSVVEMLSAQGRNEVVAHQRVCRPWGVFQQIDNGDRYQVKRITVSPGQKLSLQMHHYRAEHWVVVNGTAHVTIDERESLLHENESIFIPLGATHRLENPGKVPLEIIEVQCGTYLGEDDIVRFEDVYGRAGS